MIKLLIPPVEKKKIMENDHRNPQPHCLQKPFILPKGHHSTPTPLPQWSHAVLTALNTVFSSDSKQFCCERIILLCLTLVSTSAHSPACRTVPTISPLPSSLTPRCLLCSLPDNVTRIGGKCLGKMSRPGDWKHRHDSAQQSGHRAGVMHSRCLQILYLSCFVSILETPY